MIVSTTDFTHTNVRNSTINPLTPLKMEVLNQHLPLKLSLLARSVGFVLPMSTS